MWIEVLITNSIFTFNGGETMDRIKKYKKDYPVSYFILASLITLILVYKFGYAIGKFVAHLGL